VEKAASTTFNNGGAMNVVTMTISVTALNRPESKTPAANPI